MITLEEIWKFEREEADESYYYQRLLDEMYEMYYSQQAEALKEE